MLNDAVTDEQLRRIYAETTTIAVVGASADATKPGNRIPTYLVEQGFEVLPVSPRAGELFSRPVSTDLSAAAAVADVDIVSVFRPPAAAARIALAAVAIGARVLWFQPGTAEEAAVAVARDGGLIVVYERCIRLEHIRLGLGQPASGHA